MCEALSSVSSTGGKKKIKSDTSKSLVLEKYGPKILLIQINIMKTIWLAKGNTNLIIMKIR
jgi:hypothetical protein